MLLPSVVIHALCWLPILAFAAAQFELTSLFHMPIHLVVSEFLLHDLALLYMLLHPLITFWASEALRQEARECCFCFRFCVPLQPFEDSSECLWTKPKKQKKKKKKKSKHGGEPIELQAQLLVDTADTMDEAEVEGAGAVSEEHIEIEEVCEDIRPSPPPHSIRPYSYRAFDGAPLVKEDSALASIEDEY